MTSINLFAKRLGTTAMCAGALLASACADGPGGLTGPSAAAAGNGIAALSASAPRSGDLHVSKNCKDYSGAAGDICSITSSNVTAIEAGSRVIYAKAADAAGLDSDVVLDTPGPGNNRAFGHCALAFATGTGLCTFNGGTGKFTHFQAQAAVSYVGGFDWAWDGTFSFDPRD